MAGPTRPGAIAGRCQPVTESVQHPVLLQASAASRLRLVGVLLALAGLGLWLRHGLEPLLYQHLFALAPCVALAQMRYGAWILLSLPLLPALLMLGYARQLRRAGQFPLSPRWLLRETRISRGVPVRRLVVVLQLGATLLILFSVMAGLALLHYAPFALECVQ